MRQEDIEETVAESGYRQIRADIIFGRLAPGQKLKLENLKSAYGTSVSTLREILNRLTSEGLVVAEGQRGFEVAGVSVADLREIAALRLLLEEHALEQSFEQGDVEWEAQLVSAHYKLARMEKVMATGDTSQAEDWKRGTCAGTILRTGGCGMGGAARFGPLQAGAHGKDHGDGRYQPGRGLEAL